MDIIGKIINVILIIMFVQDIYRNNQFAHWYLLVFFVNPDDQIGTGY